MSTGLQELTKAQLVYVPFDTDLYRPGDLLTYDQYRDLRCDPTIYLARSLISAPIIASKWVVQEMGDKAPEGAVEFINEQVTPIRFRVLQQSVLGGMDFGWQPFEVVFKLTQEKKIGIGRAKPLLQDITEILIVPQTGEFDGFTQESSSIPIVLPVENSLLVSFEVEGTQWYGRPLIHNAYGAYTSWNDSNDAASRYDKKIAGAHWVIEYPVGTTYYNGVERSNDEIANTILSQLRSSGGIAIPRDMMNMVADLGAGSKEKAWSIELKSDSGSSSASFVDRQRYLDALKVRAMGVPERAVLEGQFGTKAEAEAHGNFAIMNMELRHTDIVDQINKQLVNRLLSWNYGVEYVDTVYIEPEPISKAAKEFLKELYMALLASPLGTEELIDRIDTDQVEETLGIPTQELTPTEIAVKQELRTPIQEEEEEEEEPEAEEEEAEEEPEAEEEE